MQWMKTKIPQTLMNMKIDVECWTFLHLLDAAHVIPDGIFFQNKINCFQKLNSLGLVHKNISDYCK